MECLFDPWALGDHAASRLLRYARRNAIGKRVNVRMNDERD